MQSLIQLVSSNLPVGQRLALERFLEDVQAGRVPGSGDEIQRLLDFIGELLPMDLGDPTLPEGYNQVFRALLANIAGLYQELDRVELSQDGLTDLNRAELDKVELALRDLASILQQARRTFPASLQFSDVWYETFGPGTQWERDRRWYLPNPALEDAGRVESFLPAFIDPEDRALKLEPGGDFCRSTNSQGEPLVHAELEELLGLSLDAAHTLPLAIDGRNDTYWRELILSNAPLQADPIQTPWLPQTYTGGAAARLHFRFPFAVPFTEFQIRPFSRYPMKVLQVVWDNRKELSDNLVTDGAFASGAVSGTTTWDAVAPSGSVSFQTSGGYGNATQVTLTPGGARAQVQNHAEFALAEDGFAYHFHLKARKDPGLALRALVSWYASGAVFLRGDWLEVEGPNREWWEFSKLLLPPTDAVSGQLLLAADGTGTAQLTDVHLSPTAGVNNLDLQADLESGLLNVPLEGATATDLWVVLCQPHYEHLQVTLPEGDLDQESLYQELLLQAEAKTETVFQIDTTPWQLEGGNTVRVGAALPRQETPLLTQARRLGGRVRQMVVDLFRFTQPDPTARSINRFLYTLGAWEVKVRHREYAPQGLWVSLPYRPRGEARELRLLTDPPLSDLTAGDPPGVRFWITARADDGLDKAQESTGRATFAASHEEAADRSDTHFPLVPITYSEIFEGTDHLGVAALRFHPYVDRERIWALQRDLTKGDVEWPLPYDPNKDVYHVYRHGTPADRAGLRGPGRVVELEDVEGYRPLQVTLKFPDGTVALPDSLGPALPGDIGYAGPEQLLVTQVEETHYSNDDDNGDSLVDPDFDLTDPDAQRLAARFKQLRKRILQRKGSDAAILELYRRLKKKRKLKQTHVLEVALQTRFGNLVTSPGGAAISLYWHKSADVVSGTALTSGALVTSGDVLISPSLYTVDPAKGVITLKAVPPSGNAAYDSWIGYYHYFRDETNGREEFAPVRTGAVPTSGVDRESPSVQSYPVTRNVTDYVQGDQRQLRKAVLDDLAEDYYPVYEYFVDERGRLVFAQSLHLFSDNLARIFVDYVTLALEPRVIVEFPKRTTGGFSLRTPVINELAIAMNSRK